MTTKQKADLISNDSLTAYYRLIDHRDKETEYKRLERIKKGAFDTTPQGITALRKTVLYDMLISDKL
tara:strand:+ start:225 stop:425 length:201 start_codon:yes stop_codon:yes gene_type:complete